MQPPSTTKPPQVRRSRFIRQPQQSGNKQITDTSFQILSIIERYRLITSSLLVRLAGGSERNNYRHLRTLFDLGYINRFSLPTVYGTPGEQVHYIDKLPTLHLLMDGGLVKPRSDSDRRRKEETIRYNQQKAYHQLHKDPDQQGKLLFIQHELMVSRFHAMLELACQKFPSKLALADWKQGSELHQSIEVPEWRESDEVELSSTTKLPHRPDAFFTLFFPQSPAEEQYSHFLYEADRNTERTRRYKLKLRAHWHAIVGQRVQRRPPYNVPSIRAVLTESIDTNWADTLRRAAQEPVVSPKPSPLFWFTSSEAFTALVLAGGRQLPRFLVEPEIILQRIWHTPVNDKPFSLLD
jgi:hypothetical protein